MEGRQLENNRKDNVIPFRAPVRPSRKRKSVNTSREVFDGYLDLLLTHDIISWHEGAKLNKAVAPLIVLVPKLTEEMKEAVRSEFAKDNQPTKYGIADDERGLWKKAAREGRSLIPGFDLKASRKHFKVTDDRHARQTVRPLRPEWKPDARMSKIPYVPSHLRQGEVFFFIILRMFRRQYMLGR